MAFSLSHRAILDSNVRHIYSGSHAGYNLRQWEAPEGSAGQGQRQSSERYRHLLCLEEYDQQYKTRLPIAPAFKRVTGKEDVFKATDPPRYHHPFYRMTNADYKQYAGQFMEERHRAWLRQRRVYTTGPQR
ncbi:uncharacterized protein LOC131955298 [Physella acuta]|uniref:uncharacterized protein LOC131955298 n=1 Tax=Physella acuta TaxID=109671 RepID=UPI0027DAD0EE|nr:uncharacterized protein LOC131955298 [Physella acuta]